MIAGSTDAPASVRVRAATLQDCDAVAPMLRELGLSAPAAPDRARAQWRRFWDENPAVRTARPRPPRGWVLEAEGGLVGFFGSIPRRYQYGERVLLGAVASQWAVRKPYRSHTHLLASAYFAQQEADFLLVTTAIAPTGRIFERFRGVPVPVPDYGRVLYWVLRPYAFLEASLARVGVGPGVRALSAGAGAPLLWADSRIRRRAPGRPHAGITADVVSVAEIDDAFDDLWARKLRERPRLLASRRAEDLRWHFGSERSLFIVRVSRRGGLDGYMVVARQEVPELGLSRAQVLDFLAVNDDPLICDVALSAAHEAARQQGCHVLEVVGLPAGVRRGMMEFRPYTREFPHFPLYFRLGPATAGLPLGEAGAWYPTLYDGDGSL